MSRRISPSEYARATLAQCQKHPVNDVVSALAEILARHGNIKLLPLIRSALINSQANDRRIILETASNLDIETVKEITALLAPKLNEPIETVVKPEILGGFRLHIGPIMSDYSLVNAVNQLKRTLQGGL